jgi:tellurite resistance protein TehA-like permease
LAELFPGYFALVMATGIIAVDALQQRVVWLARTLLWTNVVFYLALWGLYLARLVGYRQRVLADLTSHQRGPAFLTMVAGTNVLGSGFVLILGWRTAGLALWVLGLALWAGLFYTVLAAVTIRTPKPDLASGIHGGWLVAALAGIGITALSIGVAVATGSRQRRPAGRPDRRRGPDG